MLRFFNQLRLTRLYQQLVKDPTRTDLIFKSIEIFQKDPKNPGIQLITERMFSVPEFAADFERGYLPKPPTLDQLKKTPAGSFGQAVYKHMSDNGLDPALFPQIKPNSKIEYISARLYQDHDLWHALLGYTVEIEDEIALQAFGVAQYGSGIAVMILSGGLLHLLQRNPKRALNAVGDLARGYNRGLEAEPIFAKHIHDWFDLPLEEVRHRCGVLMPETTVTRRLS